MSTAVLNIVPVGELIEEHGHSVEAWLRAARATGIEPHYIGRIPHFNRRDVPRLVKHLNHPPKNN